MDYSRIDMMLLAERGRTRNLWVYLQTFTQKRLGWNFGSNLPVILYAIRFGLSGELIKQITQ